MTWAVWSLMAGSTTVMLAGALLEWRRSPRARKLGSRLVLAGAIGYGLSVLFVLL